MKPDLLRDLESVLGAQNIGQRFWFSLGLNQEKVLNHIWIEDFAADPSMTNLQKKLEEIEIPSGTMSVTGVGFVEGDGSISMGSPLFSPTTLVALSEWVQGHVQQYPTLARFKNTKLLKINSKGVLEHSLSSPILWQGIGNPNCSGTIQDTKIRIENMEAGNRYWFWMTTSGPENSPFLYLGNIDNDKAGSAFAAKIVSFRQISSQRGTEFTGQVQKTAQNTLLFISREDITNAVGIMHGLMKHDALNPYLFDAVLVQNGEKNFEKVILMDMEDPATEESPKEQSLLIDTASVLDDLNTGDKRYFWFGKTAERRMLILSESKDALREKVTQFGENAQGIQGQVVYSSKGWLEFRSKTAFTKFIARLAKWVYQNQVEAPILRKLKGARFVYKNKNGEIADRQKDDALWEKIIH